MFNPHRNTFMESIAEQEGFYVIGSRARRNWNPGNINFEPWMEKMYGAELETIPHGYKETPRFANFHTEEIGFQAMRAVLERHYVGLTIQQAVNKWAPPSDGNDALSYAANVARWMQATPETVLTAEMLGE